jgi:hypothetical protein
VSIKPANYVPSGDLKELVAPLQKRHEARIAKDKEFQDLREDIAEVMKLRKENAISLNEAVRRKERDAQDARAKMREARLAAGKGATTPDEPAAAPGGKEARSKVPEPTKPAKTVVASRSRSATTACRPTNAPGGRDWLPRRQPRTRRTCCCRKRPTSWPTKPACSRPTPAWPRA